MAATAPSLNTRQPLGSVSGARLRNLGQIKNKQNALSTSSPSLKSSASQLQIFNDYDSENIDPSIFNKSSYPSSKSSNTTFDSDPSSMKSFKAAHFVLSKATSTAPINASLAPAAGLKRKASTLDQAPSLPPLSERPIKALRTTPQPSIPAPAGRSPIKSKGPGILSRRRVSAKPFTRVDPPSFGATGLPFSLDAALAGTIPDYKPKQPKVVATLLDSKPKRWSFKIHEDTEDQEKTILMEHSTSTLDISGDESRAARKDDRGKENIPPVADLNAPVRSTSRNDMMSDDTRAPLADLNAKDYYAQGCDESSFFTVPAEGSMDSDKEQSNQSNIYDKESSNICNNDAAITNQFPEPESAKVVNEVTA